MEIKYDFIITLFLNDRKEVTYIKESSVCWYDGLSCKLNDLLVVEGSIPFSPNFYLSISSKMYLKLHLSTR